MEEPGRCGHVQPGPGRGDEPGDLPRTVAVARPEPLPGPRQAQPPAHLQLPQVSHRQLCKRDEVSSDEMFGILSHHKSCQSFIEIRVLQLNLTKGCKPQLIVHSS